MCVNSPTVASTAWSGPDLVNSWMINSLSEGHKNMWVLPGWFIKDTTKCERRSFVTDGVGNNICHCCWQIRRGGCHCQCAWDRLIGWTLEADANRTANKLLAPEGFAHQAEPFSPQKESNYLILISAHLFLFNGLNRPHHGAIYLPLCMVTHIC